MGVEFSILRSVLVMYGEICYDLRHGRINGTTYILSNNPEVHINHFIWYIIIPDLNLRVSEIKPKVSLKIEIQHDESIYCLIALEIVIRNDIM